MTAIIGYIARKGESSIGILCADDLEAWSMAKADKLTKLSNRYVIGVVGLEAVDWAISFTIAHFEQFSGSKAKLDSVSQLENVLNDLIPDTFMKWKESQFFDNIDKQIDIESMLIVLDLFDNSLYYSNLGKVWRIDETRDYEIKFEKLSDGFYTFGAAAVSDTYDRENYSNLVVQDVEDYLNNKMRQHKSNYPDKVGNVGAKQVNVIGEISYESFTSCFSSPFDLIENMINRKESSKN